MKSQLEFLMHNIVGKEGPIEGLNDLAHAHYYCQGGSKGSVRWSFFYNSIQVRYLSRVS